MLKSKKLWGVAAILLCAVAFGANVIRQDLRLGNSANSYYLGFHIPSLSASKTFTLPSGDGSNGQGLVTNGSGTLSWASSTGVGITQNAIVMGNGSSAIGAAPGINYAGTSGELQLGTGTVIGAGGSNSLNILGTGGLILDSSGTYAIVPNTSTTNIRFAGGAGLELTNGSSSPILIATGSSSNALFVAQAGGTSPRPIVVGPTPGISSTSGLMIVRGAIPASGTTPTAGEGFSYTHTNGTGSYTITFTTAFQDQPACVGTIINSSGTNGNQLYTTTVSPSAVTFFSNYFTLSAGSCSSTTNPNFCSTGTTTTGNYGDCTSGVFSLSGGQSLSSTTTTSCGAPSQNFAAGDISFSFQCIGQRNSSY